MDIKKYNNQTNFNGLYLKKVSPEVAQALQNSPVIQKMSQNYDVFVTQYAEPKRTPYGKILEYGLRFRYMEIVPNLFHKKIHYSGKGSSDFALDLNSHKSGKEIQSIINSDLATEAKLIRIDAFKEWFRRPY